jgi:hypothetical protein
MAGHNSDLIQHVYFLSVRRQFPDGQWGYMSIGYYTSATEAEAGKARLRGQKCFAKLAEECFVLKCYRVNVEYDDPMFSAQFLSP